MRLDKGILLLIDLGMVFTELLAGFLDCLLSFLLRNSLLG
jgi:hypothetical protein